MRSTLKLTAFVAIMGFGLWAYSSQVGAYRAVVGDQLAEMGYENIVVETSPASWVCAKNRLVYRYRATMGGRPVSGHACAGWPIGVAINPDGQ